MVTMDMNVARVSAFCPGIDSSTKDSALCRSLPASRDHDGHVHASTGRALATDYKLRRDNMTYLQRQNQQAAEIRFVFHKAYCIVANPAKKYTDFRGLGMGSARCRPQLSRFLQIAKAASIH